MESPLAMQVRYCLVGGTGVSQPAKSHVFFRRQFKEAQRLAEVAILRSLLQRSVLQLFLSSAHGPVGPAGALPGPTPGGRVGFVGSGGGYGCLWWIYHDISAVV